MGGIAHSDTGLSSSPEISTLMSMSTSRFLYQLIAVTVGAGMIFVAAHLLDDFELKNQNNSICIILNK